MSATSAAAARLVGTWRLRSFVITFEDGRTPQHPFGRQPLGKLIYTAEGHMSGTLSKRQRDPLGVGRLERYTKAHESARADAFDTYLAYAGRWRLEALPGEGVEVVHEVELALLPDLVGEENRRRVTFVDEQTVELSYELVAPSGLRRTYTLTWERA